MSVTDRDGVGINYDVQGTGGPDVLLLPGWMITDSQAASMGAPPRGRHGRGTRSIDNGSRPEPSIGDHRAELIVRQVFAC